MHAKLTLRMNDGLIAHAKDTARSEGKSVSQMVADYFTALNVKQQQNQAAPTQPITAQLTGCLAQTSLDEQDYRDYLVDKHR